jgi:outer membrane protein assembly factor BamD (BamD/ComL family)
MAKKVSRKQLLKNPDEFLTFYERVALFVREHTGPFKVAGIVVAVALLAYLGITAYLNYVNKKGQTAYNKAYDEFVTVMEKEPGKRDLKKPEELFRKVVEDYGFSRVSLLAPSQEAYLEFQEKKYDDAISLYNAFLKKAPGPIYQSLARLAIAACYEEKGELAMAVDKLKEITARPSSPFKDQAMLGLARVYHLSNQNEKAKEILKEFVESFKDSPLLPEAHAYLAEYGS